MKTAMLTLTFLAAVWNIGCSSPNATLEKAKAEADAAKTELARVKAELDLLKTQLAGQGGNSPSNAEEAVRKAVCDFCLDLNQGRLRSAYDSMSAAYRMRVERTAFDQFLETHPALSRVATINLGQPEFRPLKIRKLAKDNIYECDFSSSGMSKGGTLTIANTTLRLVPEDGAWKIDEFVEVKESLP